MHIEVFLLEGWFQTAWYQGAAIFSPVLCQLAYTTHRNRGRSVAAILWFASGRAQADEPQTHEEMIALESVQYPGIDLMCSLLDCLSDPTFDCDESLDESIAIIPE
jgi:hypothetical protein